MRDYIATHNDTDVIHSHIIVNSVNFETGKKLHLNDKEYADCKDMANILAEPKGLTTLDWRTLTAEKRAKNKEGINNTEPKLLSNAELQISKRANLETASWKEALRIAIDEAKALCHDRASFESYLKNNYGVEMPRNTGKTVSFRHPAVDKPIRGVKLGSDYTADSIDLALQISMERIMENARLLPAESAEPITTTATTTSPTPNDPATSQERFSQVRSRERLAPRSVSDISREMRKLDETVGRIASGVSEGSEGSDNAISKGVHGDSSRHENPTGGSVYADRAEQPIQSKIDKPVQPKPPEPVIETGEHERSVQQKPKRRTHSR